MGVRFRKSIKIAKGVKVNFSKSGASLSLGGAGHSVNFSSRGTRTTVGIPGTGLSYSKTYSNKRKTKPAHTSSSHTSDNHASFVENVKYEVHMDSDGHITFFYLDGTPIMDSTLIRRIKSTDQFKSLKYNLESQRQNNLRMEVENAEQENLRFLNIYKLVPIIDNPCQCVAEYNNLKPQFYIQKKFDLPKPDRFFTKRNLEKEAEKVINGISFLGASKKRNQFVEDNLEIRYQAEVNEWEKQKATFEKNEVLLASKTNQRYITEFNETKTYLESVIAGDEEFICQLIDEWIGNLELPVSLDISYDYKESNGAVYLDVRLPLMEELPQTTKIRLASGNVREKKKTQAVLKEEYAKVVFGLALFISMNIYNISPAIKKMVISGFIPKRGNDGKLEDSYIYSIQFIREEMEQVNLDLINNPIDFCLNCNCKCKLTSTLLFKEIKPFE